jgi:hypothetical protein
MSRFNVRAIAPPVVAEVYVPADKKPSAYSAFKGRGVSAPPAMMAVAEPEGGGGRAERRTGGGRPTKDELRKRKLDMADASIQVLMVAKPNRTKIREYIQNRILALDAEKR